MNPENKRILFGTSFKLSTKTYFVFTDPLGFDSVDTFLLLETVIALALLHLEIWYTSLNLQCRLILKRGSMLHIYYLQISIEYIN